jgi:hypothetical protein
MKLMSKNSVVAGLAVMFASCSTVPVPLSDAETVPREQVLGSVQIVSAAPATVTVIRDRAFVAGSVVSFFFAVNGTEVVQLRTGQKYSLLVNPGETFLSVRTNAAGGTNKPLQIQTTLLPSKRYVYRVGNDSNWTPNMMRDLELSDK